MPRGYTPRAAAMLRRAVSSCLESLETRQMLTTLQGGDTFDYLDAEDNTIRIQLEGDIVAEFVGARVREENEPSGPAGSVRIRDLVEAPPPGSDATPDGVDLFQIYIFAANPNASIIISQITITEDDETINPYSGSVGPIRIINNNNGELETVTPGGGGQVYIGARTVDIFDGTTDEQERPILFNSFRGALGVRPATKGIWAGIESAPGVALDKIFIAGTITGRIFVDGNVNTLYAGDILTGDAGGLNANDNPVLADNVYIGGDLRNLLVRGSIGTTGVAALISDQVYRTGTDIFIKGKLGNVQVLEDYLASVQVLNSTAVETILDPFVELDYHLAANEETGDAFMRGNIADDGFHNDVADGSKDSQNVAAFKTQFGYSHGSTLSGLSQSLDFSGDLNSRKGDDNDNYSLPLIAGQTITVRLDSLGGARVGLIDPLGRLVATDFPDPGGAGTNETFQFTATTPGNYRLYVASPLDGVFTSDPEDLVIVTDYTLNISGYGEIGFGGAAVGGEALMMEQGIGVLVHRGDLGALDIGGNINAAFLSPVQALRGNLRAFNAGSIGNEDEGELDLMVPRGSVGYLQTDGAMWLNASAVDGSGGFDPQMAIGFDYQRVETGGALHANLVANRAIGSIVANSIPDNVIFRVNADEIGEDGRIDLIDVTGDLGSEETGGPGLLTGPGGNIKYIRVGADGQIFPDRFFASGGLNAEFTAPLGKSVQLVDDSGAAATISPTSFTTVVNGVSNTTLGQLTYTPYGVRDHGGAVLINLESTTSLNIITSNRVGTFDISEITVNGTGTPVIYDAVRDVVEFQRTGTPVNPTGVNRRPTLVNALQFSGRSPINVMSVDGTNITAVNNLTAGEVSAVEADTLGSFTAQSVGYVKSSGAWKVLPNINIPVNTYPFNNHSFGFNVAGPTLEVFSREAIGDMYFDGAVGQIRANADAANNRKVFEGIAGTIRGTILQKIDIGEGVAFGGSGQVVGGGIFAQGADATIDQIIGNNADIRGIIGSERKIGDITLTNGSLINAIIGTPTDITIWRWIGVPFETTDAPGEPDVVGGPVIPEYGINSIRLSGVGGIIGSRISTSDFNAIDVRGGFGIIDSRITALPVNNPSNVIATDGLGIRFTLIAARGALNRVEVRGNGEKLKVTSYSPSVLQSTGRRKFDAYTGRSLGFSNDLHKLLGTSKSNPAISGVTNAGIIEDTVITGSLTLGSLDAYLIRDDVTNSLSPASDAYPMRVSFAGGVGKIRARSAIQGLQVRAGKLDELSAGGNMEDVGVRIAGRIKTIAAGRNIRGTASFAATGPEGAIDYFYAKRGNYGAVTATKDIGLIDVGFLGGDPGLGVRTLGKIDKLNVRESVLAGSYVRAAKGMNTLFVAGDVQDGAKISAKSFGTVTILGATDGDVVVE